MYSNILTIHSGPDFLKDWVFKNTCKHQSNKNKQKNKNKNMQADLLKGLMGIVFLLEQNAHVVSPNEYVIWYISTLKYTGVLVQIN